MSRQQIAQVGFAPFEDVGCVRDGVDCGLHLIEQGSQSHGA
jgi:hypothetical protein